MPHGSVADDRRFGAYGLCLDGIGPELLVPAEREWPDLKLERRVGRPGYRRDRVSGTRAQLALSSGGGLVIERSPSRATFTTPALITDAELIHPYLGTAAAVVAYWRGREVLHAGGFVAGSNAWAVLGERDAGKSSLLAWLALAGYPIVSDDILVIEDTVVFAGPRSIDLRESAAAALRAGIPIGVVGTRERWRLKVEAVQPDAPLRGWIFLAWADEVMVTRLRAADVLMRLAAQRAVRLPPSDGGHLLRLSALPAWELRRPRDWRQLRFGADSLLDRLA